MLSAALLAAGGAPRGASPGGGGGSEVGDPESAAGGAEEELPLLGGELADLLLASRERDRDWTHIPDLDAFLTRLYGYWADRGFACSLLSRCLNLATLAFTIAFTAFLLLAVDWGALATQARRRRRRRRRRQPRGRPRFRSGGGHRRTPSPRPRPRRSPAPFGTASPACSAAPACPSATLWLWACGVAR